MKAIERAKKHFESQQAQLIEVEQWADDQGRAMSIWISPLTVKDRDHLIQLEKRYGKTLELLVHVLILHAKDAQGHNLFTLEDKHDLMHNCDPNVIAAVADRIVDNFSTPAEIKKKSKLTDTSD